MEYLAPVIEGYPLPVDEFGDLEVDDYEQALKDLRKWFPCAHLINLALPY